MPQNSKGQRSEQEARRVQCVISSVPIPCCAQCQRAQAPSSLDNRQNPWMLLLTLTGFPKACHRQAVVGDRHPASQASPEGAPHMPALLSHCGQSEWKPCFNVWLAKGRDERPTHLSNVLSGPRAEFDVRSLRRGAGWVKPAAHGNTFTVGRKGH